MDNVQHLKISSNIIIYYWFYNKLCFVFHICKHFKDNMCILLVLGKNIETTKATKLNAEKLPIYSSGNKSTEFVDIDGLTSNDTMFFP